MKHKKTMQELIDEVKLMLDGSVDVKELLMRDVENFQFEVDEAKYELGRYVKILINLIGKEATKDVIIKMIQ